VADHWVRFHSLPGSKRHAENETEYGEVLHRHNEILDELTRGQHAAASLLVITASWSGKPTPVAREAELDYLLPFPTYWKTLPLETDGAWESWIHLYLNETQLKSVRLDHLFRIVANDGASETIIMPSDLRWLYHPYAGGADVVTASIDQRDALRVRHRAWLSTHPLGL
jgi:hypothetical protein